MNIFKSKWKCRDGSAQSKSRVSEEKFILLPKIVCKKIVQKCKNVSNMCKKVKIVAKKISANCSNQVINLMPKVVHSSTTVKNSIQAQSKVPKCIAQVEENSIVADIAIIHSDVIDKPTPDLITQSSVQNVHHDFPDIVLPLDEPVSNMDRLSSNLNSSVVDQETEPLRIDDGVYLDSTEKTKISHTFYEHYSSVYSNVEKFLNSFGSTVSSPGRVANLLLSNPLFMQGHIIPISMELCCTNCDRYFGLTLPERKRLLKGISYSPGNGMWDPGPIALN